MLYLEGVMMLYKQEDENFDRNTQHDDLLSSSPFSVFDSWFDLAKESGEGEPHTMVVATSVNGQPSSRCVYLTEVFENEFVFYTNYSSRKSQEIQTNPCVSLLFNWSSCHRQVRVEGVAKKLSDERSDEYFNQRAQSSRIASIISRQSQPLSSRESLEKLFNDYQDNGEDLKRPKYWGGYSVQPNKFNFLILRKYRLHDSYNYIKTNSDWAVERVFP